MGQCQIQFWYEFNLQPHPPQALKNPTPQKPSPLSPPYLPIMIHNKVRTIRQSRVLRDHLICYCVGNQNCQLSLFLFCPLSLSLIFILSPSSSFCVSLHDSLSVCRSVSLRFRMWGAPRNFIVKLHLRNATRFSSNTRIQGIHFMFRIKRHKTRDYLIWH